MMTSVSYMRTNGVFFVKVFFVVLQAHKILSMRLAHSHLVYFIFLFNDKLFNVELLTLFSCISIIKLGSIVYNQNSTEAKPENIIYLRNKKTLFIFFYVKAYASIHIIKYSTSTNRIYLFIEVLRNGYNMYILHRVKGQEMQ